MLKDHSEYVVVNKVPMTCFTGIKGSKLILVNTESEWEAFFEELMKQTLVACDTETNGFDYFQNDRIIGLVFGWGKERNFYIPVRHRTSQLHGDPGQQLSMDYIRYDVQKFFNQENVTTVWHNSKFDIHFYQADEIDVKCKVEDTALLWSLYDENAPVALKSITSGWKDLSGLYHKGLVDPQAAYMEKIISASRKEEARARKKSETTWVSCKAKELKNSLEHMDKKHNELRTYVKENCLQEFQWHNKTTVAAVTYDYVPIPVMTEYAALDAFLTYEVWKFLHNNKNINHNLLLLYEEEKKLSKNLINIERTGALINREALSKLDSELSDEIEGVKKEIISEVIGKLGDDEEAVEYANNVLLSSPDQLSALLIKLGIELTKTTDSGKLSVDAKVLKELRHHFIVDRVLELRGKEKLLSTYVRGIGNKLTKYDRLHCTFNQMVRTGRMSSSKPNLQNIPGKDTRIREAFIVPNDYIYILADYSQVEVRLTAHYSNDELLLEAYRLGQDVHTRTACEMFHIKYVDMDKVIREDDKSHPQYVYWNILRKLAKIINFGIIYGVSPIGLAELIPRPDKYINASMDEWIDVCAEYVDTYMNTYKGVKRFVETSSREVAKRGQVANHFGRIRRLPDAFAVKQDGSPAYGLRRRAERQGTNFKIQGTAADVFKLATNRVSDLLDGSKSSIINLVHDEIQLYLHKSETRLLNPMREAMEDFDFNVKLKADFSFSKKNWADKRKLG